MKVNVTDDDDPGTEHTQISFSLVEQSSSGMMFSMNHKTGEIVVRQTSLDREVRGHDQHQSSQYANWDYNETGAMQINPHGLNEDLKSYEAEIQFLLTMTLEFSTQSGVDT